MEATLNLGKDRVREVTSDKLNSKIDNEINQCVSYYSDQPIGNIAKRIRELDQEWDVERFLELNAALFSLGGIVLAATVNKNWLILPAVVTSFLAQHAIQGWCPPLPVLRKLGIRTQKEIEKERLALVELIERKSMSD